MDDPGDGPFDDATLDDVREVLARHSVSFALLFGSGARAPTAEVGDVDLAVEFEELRPDDDGYSEVYLRLLSDLEETLSFDVDVVDVHTMPPRFGHVVFDQGVLLLGDEQRRAELEQTIAGDELTVKEARERVASAVDRLREESSG
ncbi:MAG: nucleotidyltransferase domain-containing protein [Haloarculaceae archaeon]